MRRSFSCLLGLLLCSVTAWGQTSQPADGPKPVQLTTSDLLQQLRQASKELPPFDTKITLTPQQQEQAAGVCALWKQAQGRVAGIPKAEDRVFVARVGAEAGFAAGDADIMLAGAKLLWQELPPDKRDKDSRATLLLA